LKNRGDNREASPSKIAKEQSASRLIDEHSDSYSLTKITEKSMDEEPSQSRLNSLTQGDSRKELRREQSVESEVQADVQAILSSALRANE